MFGEGEWVTYQEIAGDDQTYAHRITAVWETDWQTYEIDLGNLACAICGEGLGLSSSSKNRADFLALWNERRHPALN
jgi:hypothetical protein